VTERKKDEAMRASIQRAKGEITDAQSELDKVIAAIEALPRAQKVTVSDVVNDAFEKLRAAKGQLEELEKLLLGAK